MLFCSFVMIVGVIAFSFANGALASIMSNYDNHNASYREKLNILEKARKDYDLPVELFSQLKKSLQYDMRKDLDDLNEFVDDLPH